MKLFEQNPMSLFVNLLQTVNHLNQLMREAQRFINSSVAAQHQLTTTLFLCWRLRIVNNMKNGYKSLQQVTNTGFWALSLKKRVR